MARRETRAVRAAELLERLERGPSFGEPTRNGAPRMMSADAATRAYRLWVASWILDELRDLVPELRPPDTLA